MMTGLKRVVLQCHNVGEKEPAWWKRVLANRVLRRANVLIVHANSEAEEAWKRTHSDVVTAFLPAHAIGRPVTRVDARKTLDVDGNVALFFGHIRPFKGLDIALDAWKRLKTDATLLVAGEPWFGFKATGKANVRFDARFIPDDEVAAYFAAADVVIAPYRAEAQSGVAMTAFHFGRPVIAARVGGLPDIIDGENGILVPPEDPAALAAAVDEFFTTRDRAAMEKAAAATARRFSWTEYARIIERYLGRP
jgi:glycosyltransferase involved in cell wall biosynthesis